MKKYTQYHTETDICIFFIIKVLDNNFRNYNLSKFKDSFTELGDSWLVGQEPLLMELDNQLYR